ncbi:MAG: glycosyltransferase [Rhizobiales bacterium]|nr:glycosyltransferase [Hyphomicrobiales bacterium]
MHLERPKHIALISPVYNDWKSFIVLAREIQATINRSEASIDIFAIDDSSTEDSREIIDSVNDLHIGISLVRLSCNLGHQRAIAVGLSLVNELDYDAVIVMDSDGEDLPSDIPAMLHAHDDNPDAIIVARRAQRSEGRVFRSGYVAFKMVFRILTGKVIDFGNFCLIPRRRVNQLTSMSELWNHLAATIVRAKIPLVRLSTKRGTRYAGRSHMSVVTLVQHGISAMSVFGDVLFVRLSVLAGLLLTAAIAVATTALIIRLFSTLAVPGWATLVVGLSALAIVQALSSLLVATMLAMSNRSTYTFIPKLHAKSFVDQIITLGSNEQRVHLRGV